MTFQLLGKAIEFSEGQKNYMEILAQYNSMASKAMAVFNANVADVLMSKYEDNSLNHYYDSHIAETKRILSKYGIYTISDGEIQQVITSANRGKTVLQRDFDKCWEEITDNVHYFESSDDRTTYVVKKSVEALNSGRFNRSIGIDIMALCDFVIDCIDENGNVDIQVVYEENANKAKAIYENLIAGNVPEQERDALASSLIELDFSETEYYRYIFRYFSRARFEIAAITRYLGIDITDLIENDIKCTFNLNSIASEEGAMAMMSELKATMEKYAISHSSVQTELEKILRDYDIKARTYGHVIYKTRELRAKAEADDKELNDLVSTKSEATKEELIALISQINGKQYDEGIKAKHIGLLRGKILDIEKSELETLLSPLNNATEAECATMMENVVAYNAVAVKKEEYIKRIQDRVNAIWEAELSAIVQGVDEMSEEMCNVAKQRIQTHRAPDQMKSKHIELVDKRIYVIWDAEDFERFSELFKQTPVDDSSVIGKNCALIKKEGRTETKELFVKAFYFLNENEVAAAAKYALAKEGGMLSSLLNIGKKESYQILTLNGRVMHPAIETAMQVQKEAKGTGLLGGLGKLKNSFGFGKATSSPNKACPNCGKAIAQDVKFCPNCGNKID